MYGTILRILARKMQCTAVPKPTGGTKANIPVACNVQIDDVFNRDVMKGSVTFHRNASNEFDSTFTLRKPKKKDGSGETTKHQVIHEIIPVVHFVPYDRGDAIGQFRAELIT